MQYKVPKKEILAFYYIQPALHSLSEKSRNIATPKVTYLISLSKHTNAF